MGYRIETYSLSELNRISIHGKVVPALFWLVPVGHWDTGELEALWNHFTQTHSIQHDLGLMLVKNGVRFDYDRMKSRQTSDLSDLTGKLEDLLPSDINTIYDNDYFLKKEVKNQALILSGSYPQPGWGVLVSLENPLNDIKRLIENNILSQLCQEVSIVFNCASSAFRNWEDVKKNKPVKGDIELVKKNKENIMNLHNILCDLLLELDKEHLNNFYYEILKQKRGNYGVNDCSSEFDSLFNLADDKFILSIMILKAVSSNITQDEINTTLIRFITEHDLKTNNLFKSKEEIINKLKKVASLFLKLSNVEMPLGNFVEWAESIYNDRINDIIRIVQDLKNKLAALIGNYELSVKNIENNYKLALSKWKEKIEQSRVEFHYKLQDVLKSHLEYGPRFLLNFEIEAKRKEIPCKSISWDPARMIGWKIIAHEIPIYKFDVTTLLQSMVDYQINNEANELDIIINGSLFTDYVHYISISNTNISPRNAAKELLEKLMRSGEIRHILRKSPNINILNKTHGELVEILLCELGWPVEKNINSRRLAECIIEMEGLPSINTTFTGNEIRTICESYCKDFVDTLASKIGDSGEELLELVFLRNPEYKSKDGGWRYEIEKLTIGSAEFVLDALLRVAFPDKEEVSNAFIESLKRLRKVFNNLSHDPPIGKTSELVQDIVLLLKYTEELISEMPWHFYPVQKNGNLPTILTGKAWSHSYKEDRQLSIIFWSSEKNFRDMLVWNPSKVNPVIPDGILINRP
jgi:hypothetical protein